VVYSRPLGYGWTHTYDMDLTFPTQAGGEPDTVIFKEPYGNLLRFNVNPDGSYSPVPGVWASMTRQGNGFPHTYVITSVNQTVYTFQEMVTPFATQVITRLIASDGTANDSFGQSVAISGNTAVVGADREDYSYFDQGAVYIFERQGSGWVQTQKIFSPAPIAHEHFGQSVAINGDTLLIGAPGDYSVNRYTQVYVFGRAVNGSWYSDENVLVGHGTGQKVVFEGDVGLMIMVIAPIPARLISTRWDRNRRAPSWCPSVTHRAT
jgi:hypothetical protein